MTSLSPLSSQVRVSQLISGVKAIATLPEVVVQINRCINDHRSTAVDLQRIIEHDPALASRLLRVVNSAFYSRTASIGSIERAIVLLGFQAVQHLAIAATIGKLFTGGKICEHFSAKDLWRHCVAVAAVSRQLALHTGADLAEEAFLGGLMHDIGLLVSLQVCRAAFRQVCDRALADADADFATIEHDIIGATHLELGAVLAGSWKFPPGVCGIAAHHDSPLKLDPRWQGVGALVYVADVLCCRQGVAFNLTARNVVMDEPLLSEFVPVSLIRLAEDHIAEWVQPALDVFDA